MKEPFVIGHKAILASAGSGKTFQLAHRYIHLLAAGVDPERIVALTFSRKAAGEIFDSIIHYLRQASLHVDQAEAVASRIHVSDLRCDQFLALLRRRCKAGHLWVARRKSTSISTDSGAI